MKTSYLKEDGESVLNNRIQSSNLSDNPKMVKDIKSNLLKSFFKTKNTTLNEEEWNAFLQEVDKVFIDLFLSIHA